MKKQLTIRRTILALALASFGVAGNALAVAEVEPNSTFGEAQALQIGSGGIATIEGGIASSNDVDFYSFSAKIGDSISLDIDGTTPPHDTMMYLFDPNGVIKAMGGDTEPLSEDPGSNPYELGADATFDPSINNFRIDMDGTWKIAVVSFQVVLGKDGAVVFSGGQTTGGYTMIVSGLKPSMDVISIDVKPGNNDRAVFNPKAKGAIPVALLSSSDFEPSEVDVASLRFGVKGDETSLIRCAKDSRDFNADGKPDRVCHFDIEKTGFAKSSTLGKISGIRGGKAFQGTGDLKVVPQKRGQ